MLERVEKALHAEVDALAFDTATDFTEENRKEEKILKIILGTATAENEEEARRASEYYDLILKECAGGDKNKVIDATQKLLKVAELLSSPNETENSDYNEEIKESADEFFRISEGIDAGAEIGSYLLGLPGMAVGGVIGGIVGCIRGILESIF